MKYKLFLPLFLLWSLLAEAAIRYEVKFDGNLDSTTLFLLNEASEMVSLQDSLPTTLAALRRRGEKDRANLLEVFQSQAYYNAKIELVLQSQQEPIQAIYKIDPGPLFTFSQFNISIQYPPNESGELIQYQDLGIYLGYPAYPKEILRAEEILLKRIKEQGYPFAIIKRDVKADLANETVIVNLQVESGPIAYFGSITFLGQKRTKESFLRKQIAWREGKIYRPSKIEKTQNYLESTGLFKSVSISYPDQPDENGNLPIEVYLHEGKQRSIGFGLQFATEMGPGVSAEWEHRNFNGHGEKLSAEATVWWQNMQTGRLSYLIPDFRRKDQSLLWQLALEQQDAPGFNGKSLSLLSRIERRVNNRIRFSYGLMFKQLASSDSDNNRDFNLLKTPLTLKWSNADNPLDPTKGASLYLKSIPSLQILSPSFLYCINEATFHHYLRLHSNGAIVLANKLTVGSIVGATAHAIPPPERFYAGSDSLLRGYRYLGVSPLNEEHEPIGGRSMIVHSLELRFRPKDRLGWVLFHDMGNVFESPFPQINHFMFQSVGIGIRYPTPIGPIRFDVAIPITKHKYVSKGYEIYFSIGQAF